MDNSYVQKLAVELISLDYEKDYHRVRDIQSRIWLVMYSQIEHTNKMRAGSEVIIVPLVGRDEILEKLWFDVLEECYGLDRKGKWRYKDRLPNGRKAASFVTFFKAYLFWRKNNEVCDELNLDSFLVPDDNEKQISVGDRYAFEKYVKDEQHKAQQESVFNRFIAITTILRERQKSVVHEGKKAQDRQMYFEAFFTFDITKGIKTFLIDKNDVDKHDEHLFPLMQILLLKYLMYGDFEEMVDIVTNELRSSTWRTRQQTVAECYNVNRRTVSKYESTRQAGDSLILGYDDFVKSIA